MKKETTYKIGNVTVIVSRPSLSESERKKRENVILTALNQYGKEATAC